MRFIAPKTTAYQLFNMLNFIKEYLTRLHSLLTSINSNILSLQQCALILTAAFVLFIKAICINLMSNELMNN